MHVVPSTIPLRRKKFTERRKASGKNPPERISSQVKGDKIKGAVGEKKGVSYKKLRSAHARGDSTKEATDNKVSLESVRVLALTFAVMSFPGVLRENLSDSLQPTCYS